MPINSKIENSNETSFPNIKIIILGVLLAALFIGGLCYYFASNKKPSEEPVQEIQETINQPEEKNQEIENNNQNNNEENIENQEEEEKEEEKQPEIIINNEYIPVIDCLWLNILFFVIVMVVSFILTTFIGEKTMNKKLFGKFFVVFEKPKDQGGVVWTKSIVVFILLQQVISYAIWFILMLIFAAFSKIWDKEHSWWSNVVKGFFRNRIHRGWWSLIPILLPIIVIIIFIIGNIR